MRTNRSLSSDRGMSLAELLVAMTIAMIVLASLVPFLVSAFRSSASSVRTAGATELVNTRIDLAQSRASSGTCVAFGKFVGTYAAAQTVTDSRRKITYEVTQAVGAADGTTLTTEAAATAHCRDVETSAASGTTYYLAVKVVDKGLNKELARAATWVAVPGFGA
ncbi:type IV pilus modification PilV family protein [Flavimobilis rhizosphaerae]|nr:type II secretion system protein [Flavimobilis rhizosphaerae]